MAILLSSGSDDNAGLEEYNEFDVEAGKGS